MLKNFDDILNLAKQKKVKTLSVAMAGDREVLLSVKMAMDEDLIKAILVGDKDEIEKICKDIGLSLENIQILHEPDPIKGSKKATELVSSGEADILMKGLVATSTIMKEVLNKETGLRTDKLISHAVVANVSTYHKIFIVTDAAMNIAPDLDKKKEIIKNGIELAKALEIENPKVAVLAAKEKVSEKMEATVHAKELKEMNKKGEIKDAIVDGPFALDNAISKESAEIKKIDSLVAGDADILLAPDIEAGNILYKSLSFLAGAKTAGLILGAKKPIVLTSRADNREAKFYSIVLSVLVSSKG
jgi:phosphate butyryltransferase